VLAHTRRARFIGVAALSSIGTIVVVGLSYVGLPRLALSAPPLYAQLGKGGERAITVYNGYVYIQKHTFLGIGIPPYRLHRYLSRDTWEWYHATNRDRYWFGLLAVEIGFERRHGVMAYWYHSEFGRERISLWLVGIPLALIGSIAVLLGWGFRCSVGWMIGRRRTGEGHCGACGYDSTGNVSGTCSECGQPVDRRLIPSTRSE